MIVRGFERVGYLSRDRDRLTVRQCAPLEPLGEILAVDKLHDQRTTGVRVLEAVHMGDVGVVERGECLGFPGESRQPLGIVGKRLRDDLDGDVAA